MQHSRVESSRYRLEASYFRPSHATCSLSILLFNGFMCGILLFMSGIQYGVKKKKNPGPISSNIYRLSL